MEVDSMPVDRRHYSATGKLRTIQIERDARRKKAENSASENAPRRASSRRTSLSDLEAAPTP
jgi:hypothetical protein